MYQKTKEFCDILSKLEDEIYDIASSFNIAIGMTADELDKDYEDNCYVTNVIVHKDFTATVNQYKKADKDLPPAEEFSPDVDKDLIPESKCWDLSKREVSTCLAAIISPWFENYLSKMKKGINTLFGLRVTCPSAIESLGLLKTAYEKGEEVFSEFKQKNDPLDFVGAFEMYLSCYCDVDEIGKRFEELQARMDIEPVEQNGGKTEKLASKIIAGSREFRRSLQEYENGLAVVSGRVQSIGRDDNGSKGIFKKILKIIVIIVATITFIGTIVGILAGLHELGLF